MNHGHVAKTVGFRHSCSTRPSDRVIAAENHRDNAAGGECAHALINTRFRFLPLAMARDGVTKVDDVEVIEDFDAEIEVIGARVIRIRSECPGSKTRAGSIGRAVIPRGTHHRDIGLDGVEIFRISNKGAHSEGGETLEGRRIELLTHARSNEIVCSHLPRVGLESPDLKGVWTFCSRPNHGCPRGGVLGANQSLPRVVSPVEYCSHHDDSPGGDHRVRRAPRRSRPVVPGSLLVQGIDAEVSDVQRPIRNGCRKAHLPRVGEKPPLHHPYLGLLRMDQCGWIKSPPCDLSPRPTGRGPGWPLLVVDESLQRRDARDGNHPDSR